MNKAAPAGRQGFALMVAIYVIVVFATIGITITAFIAGESISNALALNGLKAFHIAEAGVDYLMASGIPPSPPWIGDTAVLYSNISLGNGSFDVILKRAGSNYTAESISYLNRGDLFYEVKRQVEVGLSVAGSPSLTKAIFSMGDIDIKNSDGTINGADLVSGGDITCTLPGSYEIFSDQTVSMPSINWDQYKALAQSQGKYYTGDLVFPDNSTGSGIYYVEGNVKFCDDVTINGSIISRGKVDMKKAENILISPEAGYPALMVNSFDGGDEAAGNKLENATINGLLYSSNDIRFIKVEDLTINGAILSGGKVMVNNSDNFTLNYNPIVQDTPFIIRGQGAGELTITSWRNL